MPYVVAAIAAVLGGGAVAVAVATIIVDVVISFALGKIAQALAGTKSDHTGPPAQQVTVQGTLEPRRMVYGQVMTNGVIAFFGTSSSAGGLQDYLWFVIAFAGHQCEAITDVMFDSVLIPDAAINPSTGVISSGQYAGFANIWRLTGSSAEVVQPDWDAAFSAIGTNHKGIGVTKLVIRMKRDTTVFPSGAPTNFAALIKGKRVYDPRLDSTNGGSGSQRLTDATTWTYSANPALCTADYFTGGSIYFDVATPIARLGVCVPTARVNWAFAAAAANECDQTVSLPGALTQPRYALGLVLTCGEIHDTNLDALLATMIGQRIFSQGMYRIYAGQYDSPALTISDSDLTPDGYTVTGSTVGTDLYNTVVATYFDPRRNWQHVTCAVRTQSTYVTADGGQVLQRNIELAGVTDEYRAQRICEVIKKQSRNQIVVSLSLKLTGVKIAPWETFFLTLAEMSWQNKVFRAQAISMDLGNRRIVITAKEESSTPYADPLTTDYAAPGTIAPSFTAETPNDPTGLTALGEPYGILFKWNADPYLAPGSYYELFEFTSSTPFASATKIASGIQSTSHLINKTDTIARFYWIRAVNPNGNASGPDPGVTGVSGAAITVDTSFITNDGVSQIASSYSSTLVFMTAQVGATNPDTRTLATLTLTFTGEPVAIDVYVAGSGGHSAGGTCSAGVLRVLRDGSAITSSQYDLIALVNAASIQPTPITLSLADAPTAASHTYTIQASITAAGAAGQFVEFNISQIFLKVREIKR